MSDGDKDFSELTESRTTLEMGGRTLPIRAVHYESDEFVDVVGIYAVQAADPKDGFELVVQLSF